VNPATARSSAGRGKSKGICSFFARSARCSSESGRGLGRISIYLETSSHLLRSPITFRSPRPVPFSSTKPANFTIESTIFNPSTKWSGPTSARPGGRPRRQLSKPARRARSTHHRTATLPRLESDYQHAAQRPPSSCPNIMTEAARDSDAVPPAPRTPTRRMPGIRVRVTDRNFQCHGTVNSILLRLSRRHGGPKHEP
jgi:hypothetical protein